MTDKEYIEYHQQLMIAILRYGIDTEEFNQWKSESWGPSSDEFPDGIFYSMEHYKKFMQRLDNEIYRNIIK